MPRPIVLTTTKTPISVLSPVVIYGHCIDTANSKQARQIVEHNSYTKQSKAFYSYIKLKVGKIKPIYESLHLNI